MYSEFRSFSFMISDDKDANSMELDFLVRSSLEFQKDKCGTATSQEGGDYDEPHHKKEERVLQPQRQDQCKFQLLSTLELKLPTLREFKVRDDGDEGLKTPTSLHRKIPVMLKCPPAPRKPKSLPSTKRPKARGGRRILLDLTKEIESLFPPALLADLGNKIKKVTLSSDAS